MRRLITTSNRHIPYRSLGYSYFSQSRHTLIYGKKSLLYLHLCLHSLSIRVKTVARSNTPAYYCKCKALIVDLIYVN